MFLGESIMNKQKRKVISQHAALARRTANETLAAYFGPYFPQDGGAKDLKIFNARHEDMRINSPAKAAFVVLQLTPSKLTKLGRILISNHQQYWGRVMGVGLRATPPAIDGRCYDEKAIMMAFLDSRWFSRYRGHRIDTVADKLIQANYR